MSNLNGSQSFLAVLSRAIENRLLAKPICEFVMVLSISLGFGLGVSHAGQATHKMVSLSDQTTLEQLKKINDQWNSLKQRSDLEIYGIDDKWSTPTETLAIGEGDCEDLAIGKYFDLLSIGIHEDQLFLLSANMAGYGAHMVLIVNTEHGILVLDNMTHEIKNLSDREDLNPVYKLNRSVMEMNLFGNKKFSPSINEKWAAMLARYDS